MTLSIYKFAKIHLTFGAILEAEELAFYLHSKKVYFNIVFLVDRLIISIPADVFLYLN